MRKFLAYIFIVVVLIGLFGVTPKAQASTANPTEACQYRVNPDFSTSVLNSPCVDGKGNQNTSTLIPTTQKPEDKQTGLEQNVPSCWNLLRFDMGKCLISISYFLLYTIPSSILALSAIFFNATIALALSSVMYTASFVSQAWVIVRDFSNIFFILILIYVAIQTILGLGHETKKVIVQVIIMALLINFSMFFTKVVIDTSNILALVFYNKINVDTPVKINDKYVVKFYNAFISSSKTGVQEKDISGGVFASFDPTKLMTPEFFQKAKVQTSAGSFLGLVAYTTGGAVVGGPIGALVGAGAYGLKAIFTSSSEVPDGLILTIIIVSGLVMSFAAYTFFIVGLTFIARIAELWILIIFAPFAFMSSTVPHLLGNVSYVGWEEWIKRLVKLSFMAPIFMFFLYLIFKIVQVPFLNGFINPEQDIYQTMLLIIFQALVVLILLHKASKYARSTSGELGELTIGGAKALVGLAVGGAALGGAALGRGTVGAVMKGASTGDTSASRIAANRAILADPHAGRFEKFRAKIDIGKGRLEQTIRLDALQQKMGGWLNEDQHHVEHAAHARHDLDEAADKVAHGKKWEDLNGEQRYQVRRQIARDRVVRENSGNTPGSIGLALGTRKWDALTTAERQAIDTSAFVGNDPATGHAIHGGALDTQTTVADSLIRDARKKQGLISSVAQSTVTGSYDARELAKIVAKEQTTGFTKLAMGLTGAVAMGMRGGFRSLDIHAGESQRNFFKDLGDTVSSALKSVKINVDVSHVGDVKKEDDHGHGGGGHH